MVVHSNYGDGDSDGGVKRVHEGTGLAEAGQRGDSLFTCRGTDRGTEFTGVAAVVKRRGGETGQRTKL
jgi:hypothetical protein